MNFYYRDADAVPPYYRDHENHRVLTRVRVDYRDPVETARQTLLAGPYVYLQFLWDDRGLHTLSVSQQQLFWRKWLKRFCDHIGDDQRDVIDFIAIEHPSLGWDHILGQAVRHTPSWQETFTYGIGMLRSLLEASVLQFGVPGNSLVLYNLPLPGNVCGEQAMRLPGAWVNIPGQWGFGDRRTTDLEFQTHMAICTALGIPDVVLWSNPSDRPSQQEQATVVETLDWLDAVQDTDAPDMDADPDLSGWFGGVA